jgi:uncharacterized protein (DUF2237 family)
MFESRNIFGQKLTPCCYSPKTGFYRDGLCNTGLEDHGIHTVCIEATEKFLAFSKSKGNDLSTPNPQFNFPGLVPGDKWCLCAGRWLEAHQAGAAPKVDLNATHEETLAIIPYDLLERYTLHPISKPQ